MSKTTLLPVLLFALTASARAQCTLLQLEDMSPDTVAVVPSIAGKPAGQDLQQGAILWTVAQAKDRLEKISGKPAGPLSGFAGAWKRVGEVVENSTGVIDMAGYDLAGYRGRLTIVDQGHVFADAGQVTIQGEPAAAEINLGLDVVRFSTSRQEGVVALQSLYFCRKVDDDSLLCFAFTKRPLVPSAANRYSDYEIIDRRWLAYVREKK